MALLRELHTHRHIKEASLSRNSGELLVAKTEELRKGGEKHLRLARFCKQAGFLRYSLPFSILVGGDKVGVTKDHALELTNHCWVTRFKKDFIFETPLVCNQPAPDVVLSKFSVEYYHMDVSTKSLSKISKMERLAGPSGTHTNSPGSDQLAQTNWGSLQLLSQVKYKHNCLVSSKTTLPNLWLFCKPTLCKPVSACSLL